MSQRGSGGSKQKLDRALLCVPYAIAAGGGEYTQSILCPPHGSLKAVFTLVARTLTPQNH